MVLALVIKFTQLIQCLGNRGALNGKPEGEKNVFLLNVFHHISYNWFTITKCIYERDILYFIIKFIITPISLQITIFVYF